MNKWFYFNILILAFAITKIFSKNVKWHLLLGLIGLLFILFNWTRHAVFSTIRATSNRRRKIKYANISKKVVHIHKWTGTTALIIAISHSLLVLRHFRFYISNFKILSGLLAGIILIFVVLAGWMRYYRPTVRKRYIHLFLGMLMIFLIAIHILL